MSASLSPSFLSEEEAAKLSESTQPELTGWLVSKAQDKIQSLSVELERTKSAYELQLQEQEKQVESLREEFNSYKSEKESSAKGDADAKETSKLAQQLESAKSTVAAYEAKMTLQTDRISSAEEVSCFPFTDLLSCTPLMNGDLT